MWEKTISVFDETQGEARQLAFFPNDRVPPEGGVEAVQVRLDQLRLENPRQWGACWLADHLWRTLKLGDFFGARLPLKPRRHRLGKRPARALVLSPALARQRVAAVPSLIFSYSLG